MGTAAYLAPEQVLGERAGSASDVFALGLVLIECLTGRREYPGSPAEAAVARLHRLPTVPQGLPRGASRMLEQMTAWDPAERPYAAECAAVFGRPGPGPIKFITSVPAFAASPFGEDEETTRVHPSLTRPASGQRRLSAALAVVAALATVGVAAIASGAGAGSPAPRVPAAVAPPQPTTVPGNGPTAGPSPQQTSSSSTPTQSSPLPGTRSAIPTVVPLVAMHVGSEAPTKKHKGHGHGKGGSSGDGNGKNS